MLAAYAPHLVLDGAEVLAALVHAATVTLAVARDNPATSSSLSARWPSGPAGRPQACRCPSRPCPAATSAARSPGSSTGSTAGRHAHLPADEAGPPGRARPQPAIVDNAETVAAVALIARHGGAWFARAGLGGASGIEPGDHLWSRGRARRLRGRAGTPLGQVLSLARPIRPGLRRPARRLRRQLRRPAPWTRPTRRRARAPSARASARA